MSKYGQLIQKARKPENQKERNVEEMAEEAQVNLGVKVPVSWRRHWAAESKRQGITMTAVIVEALTEKFGKP